VRLTKCGDQTLLLVLGLALPPDVANSEHFSFENDNSFNFDKWNIPKLSPKDIYTSSSWLKSSFRSEYSVKTVEQIFAISSNNSTFQLFNKRFIENSEAKGYKFLHVGSVQVVVKPLTRLGINAFVFLCLRDARFVNFRISILGMIQSSLFAGPIHFDVYGCHSCKPSQDFTHPLGMPRGLNGLLHMLNAIVSPTTKDLCLLLSFYF
jgi:hypothetical protein